jgi:hypothetical protein
MDHHVIAVVLLLLGGGVFIGLTALLRGYRSLCEFAERIFSPE